MNRRSERTQIVDLLRRGESAEFRLLRPAAGADPYPTYRALAAAGPLFRSALGVWLVTGYEQCATLLRDKRLGALSDLANRPDVVRGRYPVLEQLHRSWFLFSDPPRHAGTRRAVAQCTARSIRTAITRDIEPLAADMVGSINWSRPIDIVTKLAQPYPMTVIGRILGVPQRDLARLRALTVAMSVSMEPFLGTARLERAEKAAHELCDYFDQLHRVGHRNRSECLDELLDSGDLEPGAGLAHAVLLLTAGQETTVNLIAMGVLALVTQRPDLDGLMAESNLVSRAVEELLRFTSPIQLVARRVLHPVGIEDASLEPGDLVWLILAAANRDPTVFVEPDGLDLTRQPNDHVAFATGSHVCFGAALTRAEMEAVLRHLAPMLDNVEADLDSVRWQRKRTTRGLDQLLLRPRDG
jgi:cytochrome P450